MRETLESQRLFLRPPKSGDAEPLRALANNPKVTRNTVSMPFPYTLDDARSYIARAKDLRAKGLGYSFAILRKTDLVLVGAIGIHPDRDSELGYWIGEPFWGQGYATEAALRVIRFAFEELAAPKITAGWFDDNPASGRVLEKLGFQHETEVERASKSRSCVAKCRIMVLTRSQFARMQAA